MLTPLWLFSLSGDGGNDVSMIQEADCGVGVEGKVRLSISSPGSGDDALAKFHSPRFLPTLSHVQQPSTQMIPLYETSIVSREEAKMTGCLCTQVKVDVSHQPASQSGPFIL